MRRIDKTFNRSTGHQSSNDQGSQPGIGIPQSHRNEFSGIAGAVVQARTIRGNISIQAPTLPAPAQLKHDPLHFTNRRAELAWLASAAGRSRTARLTIVVLTGVGGIGKTACALHWLHQIRGHFPDGQLFADLRGLSTIGPADPRTILARFIRGFGVPPGYVPDDLEELAALHRSLTTDRRMIVMLDNAASDDQLQPLLPGQGPSLVVVTAREPMPGLHSAGAQHLRLGPLDEDHAVELLARTAGPDRVAAEPHQARSLAARCGHRPLDLCVFGAALATGQHRSISQLLTEIQTPTSAAPRTGDTVTHDNVPALTTVYDQLPPAAQAMYRRVASVHPGQDFTADHAAAAAGISRQEALALLTVLTEARLVEAVSGRYSYLDEVRAHARAMAERFDSATELQECFTRLAEHLRRVAVAAQRTINPARPYFGRDYESEPVVHFANPATALAWMDTEWDTLRAVARDAYQRGLKQITWEIVEALWGRYVQHRRNNDCVEDHTLGLRAARECGAPQAESRMLHGLAFGHLNLGHHADAIEYARQAQELDRGNGNQMGEATAQEIIGSAFLSSGEPENAATHFMRCREIHRAVNDPRATAIDERHLGDAAARAGRTADAAAHYETALLFFDRSPQEGYLQCRTRTLYGDSLLAEDRTAAAYDVLHAALRIATRVDAPIEAARAREGLATVAIRRDNPTEARDHLEQAIAIYTGLHMPREAARVESRLAALNRTHNIAI